MNLFISEAKIVITCNKRLAPYLQQEIVSLGGKNLQAFPTRIELKGTLNDCIRYNLCLRCASQVLYELASFPARDAHELYENVKQIEWEEIIPTTAHFSITSNVFNDTINNNMFANLRVKDAIVDRIRTKTGKRPNSGATLDATVIHLHWQEDTAKVFIDTSGQSIARHGYRKFPGRAPMLEALATATILASAWTGRTNFINPMCGSGTLAIEAALLATDTKPGLFRSN
ncbi:MAG: class I SAM-dependent RNA methyltransferase, partial [Bacteroidetes bacterium]|nr:class I SAM-dependent RNA methyltransferase [Bacteroidota bacterium]